MKKLKNQIQYFFNIIILWQLVINISVHGQDMHSIKLNHFSSSHKLPGASIQYVYQDKVGLLWLGIESEGVTKYDGKSYTIFKNSPSDTTTISNNFPVDIAEDDLGNIWTTTLFGLNKIERKTFKITRFIHSQNDTNSISNNYLQGIEKDKFGNLWVASSNGISIINPNRNEVIKLFFNSDINKPGDNIYFTNFHFDEENNVWIGMSTKGFFMLEYKNYSPFMKEWINKSKTKINQHINIQNIHQWQITPDGSSAQNAIRSISSSSPDSIWLGTQNGLFLFHRKKEIFEKINVTNPSMTRLNNSTFLCLLVDSRKNLWAGTSNDGLMIIENKDKEIHHLNNEDASSNNLFSNAIRSIIESESGLIWIATKFAGLHYYDKRQEQFKLIKKATNNEKGLNSSYCLCTFEDSKGIIWIGTKTGGLNRYNKTTNEFEWITPNPNNPNTLKSKRIEMICEDNNSNLWLATDAGVAKYNKHTKRFNHYLNQHFRNILYTADKKIWLGFDNGLFIFDPEKKNIHNIKTKHTDFFNKENNNSISIIFEDNKGIKWIGTQNNGLFKYIPTKDSLIHYTHNKSDSNSISGNMIRAIYLDSQSKLWIGTKSDGFNLYNNNTFKRYSSLKYFPSNTVYHFIEDNNNNLWMGTHNGIIKFNPNTNNYQNFNANYGLQSLIFEAHASCKTKDGLILMGGSQGVNVFNPETIKKQSYSAPLIISKFNSFNKPIDKDISVQKHYKLSRKDNYLTIEFALLDYSNPDENKYEYKLENFDINWISSEYRNFASYTNLPPGNYTFKVRGSNSDVDWNKKSFEISFFIPSPIWKKWWFILSLILLSVTLILMLYYIRIASIKRREIQLKQLVRQRTKDLSDAYQKLEISKKEIEHTNTELLIQRDQIRHQNEELENHRINLENIVKERTKDLDTAKRKAEESDLLKSAFLANMSHEIRTPLNAIMGFVDILEANIFDKDERDKIIHIIHSNSNILLQLINDIIDISIIEANQIKLNYTTIKINHFLEEISADYLTHKELLSKNVELKLEIPNKNEDLELYTAPERLKQIITNLINNAIKFTHKGYIKFGYKTIKPNDQIIVFYIKDSGIGIEEKNTKLIFDRFRKIESPTKIFRGTGLGLSICKNLCQLLGGDIWVESVINKGSTFFFKLPIHLSSLSNTSINKNHKTFATKKTEYNWSDKTILIAEDEDSNFDIIQYMLRTTKIKIIRADNGQEAIDIFNNIQHISLILMDIKMPVLNGIEAMRIIKEKNPHIPIIAQTAYALQQERDNYLKEGFDDYITKPINSNLLIKKLYQTLNNIKSN
ncbi:MAG: response regulator [Marinilabiliaceae bacterium]|nr:response regulator [Marinilabiliaceae bacterium]